LSDAWGGGKGDKNRVSDSYTYGSNYDKIFRKMTGYNLFLDDYRVPEKTFLPDGNVYLLDASRTRKWDWEIVRSYKAFVDMIDKFGIPKMVSLDNDLTEEHMKAYHLAVQHDKYVWEHFNDTGIHCVLYLIEACKKAGVPFPPYYIHSANYFARPIMRKLIGTNTVIKN
jgi:hypothetical protein